MNMLHNMDDNGDERGQKPWKRMHYLDVIIRSLLHWVGSHRQCSLPLHQLVHARPADRRARIFIHQRLLTDDGHACLSRGPLLGKLVSMVR